MRVLIVSEFDPAGVGLGHRDALRAAGHDAQLALHFAYKPRDLEANFVWMEATDKNGRRKLPLDVENLKAFANEADALVFCPGIGQPWSWSEPTWDPRNDAPFINYLGVDWANLPSKASLRVAFIHGSRNAWANRHQYAEHFRGAGWELAASTLDYAVEMDAAYLPPVLSAARPTFAPPHAAPRLPHEPLRLVHAPTDPVNCSTPELLRMLADLGGQLPLSFQVLTCEEHSRVIFAKEQAHACFDHLRGSFSVNTLEAARAGLALLVGLKPEYRKRLLADGFPDLPNFQIESIDDVRRALVDLAKNATLTAQCQGQSYSWFKDFTHRARVALLQFYTGS